MEKGLPECVFAHHVFHVYAPAVVQNLLPMLISVEAEVVSIVCICSSRFEWWLFVLQDGSLHPIQLKPGESHEFHQFSVSNPPVLIVEVRQLHVPY